MAFEDKKGIVVASPFKLQAEALLDVRQQVDTIAERDRLVTLKAATAGLRVFVKENSTSYVYTGSKWDPLATGAPYKHPTGDGNHHVPATGTTNAGKYLKAGATAGSEAWSKIAASDITGLPTRLPNPQTLTIRSNDTNTSVDYTGAEAKTLTMSPEWVYGASDAPLSKIEEYSEKETRYVKVLDIESNKDNLWSRVQQQFLIMGFNFSFILNLCAYQSNSKIFNYYSASYITTSANGVDDSRFLLGVKNINSESNKIELWYKQDRWTSALAVLPKGRSGETTRVFNLYSVNNTDHPVTTAPVFDISIPIKNNYKIYTTTGQATDGSMTQKAITDALNSKASSSHTHTASQITGLPTSLKNPYALTIKTNDTSVATYDGSVVKEVNITAASIGAAASSHGHSAFKGATGTVAGGTGFVPAPAIGEQDKFLRGDGTWQPISLTLSVLGVTASAAELNHMKGVTSAVQTQLNNKAPASHTHPVSQITGLPTKLPNPQALKFTGAVTATYDGSGAVTVNIPTAQASPYALTLQLNGGTSEGTNKFTFNGGAAKTVNITPAAIGAAASYHEHSYLKVPDTRNENPLPSDNEFKKNAVSFDFKLASKIGVPIPNLTYVGLMSFAPWSETSGGNGYQMSYGYLSDGDHTSPRLSIRTADLSAKAWGSWYKIYTSADKPTPSEIGAAAASHTHSASQITGLPTSLKNPYALTVKTNGTTAATYDGSAAKEVNITPAAIGAAAASHTHSGYAPTSHSHAIGNSTTPGFTKLWKWADNVDQNDLTGAITSEFLSNFAAQKVFPKIINNATGINNIITGTTLAGKAKAVADSANNNAITISYQEASATSFSYIPVFTGAGHIGNISKSNFRSQIDAAPTSHTHNYAGSSSAGGPANSAKKVDVPVGTVMWSTSSSSTFFAATMGGTWEVVGNIDAIINTSTSITFYLHKKKAL